MNYSRGQAYAFDCLVQCYLSAGKPVHIQSVAEFGCNRAKATGLSGKSFETIRRRLQELAQRGEIKREGGFYWV